MFKTKIDDNFYNYLVKDARLVGKPGIPMLMKTNNAQVPKGLIPFDKARKRICLNRYIHFYLFDKFFSSILTATKKHIDLLKSYAGVITPDFSILINQAKCLQETNTYFSRAVGFYLQKQGIPVIPNVRWGDKSTYDFCFLGIPKNSIVAISTHGCIRNKDLREIFKKGLHQMLKVIEPTDVIVHGSKAKDIFNKYANNTRFHFYPSWASEMLKKKDGD